MGVSRLRRPHSPLAILSIPPPQTRRPLLLVNPRLSRPPYAFIIHLCFHSFPSLRRWTHWICDFRRTSGWRDTHLPLSSLMYLRNRSLFFHTWHCDCIGHECRRDSPHSIREVSTSHPDTDVSAAEINPAQIDGSIASCRLGLTVARSVLQPPLFKSGPPLPPSKSSLRAPTFPRHRVEFPALTSTSAGTP